MSTAASDYITSTIAVSGFPVSTFDSSVMISITLSLVHPNPQDLMMYVVDAGGVFGSVLGYKSSGSIVPCPTYYSTTFADSQIYQNLVQASASIPCPPSTVTALGNSYTSSGFFLSGTFGSTPCATLYAGHVINGNWMFVIKYDVSEPTGILYGWSINLYCKTNSLLLI